MDFWLNLFPIIIFLDKIGKKFKKFKFKRES